MADNNSASHVSATASSNPTHTATTSTSATTANTGQQQQQLNNSSNAAASNNSTTTSSNKTTTTNNNLPTNQTNQQTGGGGASTAATSAAAFVPLTRARFRETRDNQQILHINTIEELVGPVDVARKARLSSLKLNEEEFAVFNDIIQDKVLIFEAYIYIRNTILEAWFDNVQKELLKQEAFERLDDGQINKHVLHLKDKLFNRTFDFLDRTGKINFGLLSGPSKNPSNSPGDRSRRAPTMASQLYKPPFKGGKRTGRVIVLGAGLSGLMAARQLQRFGMEVIVLEARSRVGGRVHTYKKGNFIADLGPSTLNGVVGNPMVTLGKQADLCVMQLKQKIPIWEHKNGTTVCHRVEHLLERAIEREYNKIIEGTRVIKHHYGITKYRGESYNVGSAVNWVMTLQEKNVKDELLRHLTIIDELYHELIESADKKLAKAKVIKTLEGQLCSMKESMDINNHKDKPVIETFQRRCLARDLDLALKEYKLLIQQEQEIHSKIALLMKQPPSDTYLSLGDRHLLDWHFAELEYALGCPINKLGIHYEDDEEIFEGPHYMLIHGFNGITEHMKSELEIMTNTAVKKVTITRTGCKVLTYQPDHAYSPYVEYTADAVLCTLPLGIIQEGIVASQQAAADTPKPDPVRTNQKGYQPIVFDPPLPKWKNNAISRLGCGNLNKIVMSFDKVFWNSENHLFGVVSHTAISRGEFFLFWHHGRTPTLTGLISGEAADMCEKVSDVEILERCLNLLRSIFGITNVPAPKDYVVTRWRKDPWAQGAWSYAKVGACGGDYDIIAEPLALDDQDETKYKTMKFDRKRIVKASAVEYMQKVKDYYEIPRLFFAGEHTSRTFFASAHGAVITGLREAAKIANIFLGCPYDPDDKPGIVIS